MIINIAENRPIFLLGLLACLQGAADIEIGATAETYTAPVSRNADVLLLGEGLAGDPPVLAGLREAASIANVLVMTSGSPPENTAALLRAGAKGCVDVRTPPAEMIDMIRAIHAGREPETTPAHGSAGVDLLSPRELTTLSYIANGYTHEQTARRMEISRHTVDTYIKRARAKLRLGNKADLTRAVIGGEP